MSIALVGGGARSGKSRHALKLARLYGARLAFIATAQAGDAEMCDRIARHGEEEPLCGAPAEVPTGVITAVLGGPFFIWLLRSRRRSVHI